MKSDVAHIVFFLCRCTRSLFFGVAVNFILLQCAGIFAIIT